MDTIILPFSRRELIILKAKNGHSTNQNNAKSIKFDAQSVKYIFWGSRQRSIKNNKTFWQNYEYNGHNLDTIMAQFFPSQKEILATFIVPILHTFGHYMTAGSSDLAKKAK